MALGALLAGLSGAAAAIGCSAPVLGALAGVERSRWEEFDAQGKSLVRERGSFKVAGLQASGNCSQVDWSAQWTRSQGQRDDDGVTTTQVPLQTQSQLRAQALTLAGWLPVSSGWAVGSQLGYRQRWWPAARCWHLSPSSGFSLLLGCCEACRAA